MKCSNCNKEIKNVYFWNGKPYGYNCYKELYTMHFAKLEKDKKIIDGMKISLLLDMKNDKFFQSCRSFFIENSFLSEKQQKILYSKLSDSEKIILKIKQLKIEKKKFIVKSLHLNNDLIEKLKYNEFFKDILNVEGYRIVQYKDIDEEDYTITYLKEKEIKELFNDEYIENIKIFN